MLRAVEPGMAVVHGRRVRILPALSVLLLAASCVGPPRGAPPPATRVVAPPPPAAPIARPTDWRDWPQTPGDWRYGRTGLASQATFGEGVAPVLVIACGNDRRVRLEWPRLPGGALTVRTTSVTRVLPVDLVGHPPTGIAATLPANDPLLDAIGFSRGRFVVEMAGAEPLVLPAWPEVERVVEDCRG